MFLSRLTVRPEVKSDPRLLPSRTKGLILATLALCATSSGFSSTIYFPGIPLITIDLHAPPIATTLTAALFILFMGIAPVFWASCSDFYQIRRFLFMTAMLIFGLASLGCALITNIWGLVVLRCVQAFGASCGQSVGAGVIADCYPIEKRGAAFSKYFFGAFFGPLLGPIVGGFLIMSHETWRSTFWFCFAYGIFVVLLVFFVYPETYRVNERWDDDGGEAASADTKTPETPALPQEKKRLNPFRPFLLLRHPHVLMPSIATGFAFGCMFATETIIPDLYKTKFGFSSWQTGLCYLGGGVGNLIGALVNNRFSDRLLLRARAKRGGRAKAEDRLSVILWPCTFIIMPFGMLLFGWGLERNVSVWTGIVGFGIQNFAMNQILTSCSAYLVDSHPGQGASATAAANFVRSLFACALTLAANPLEAAIGPGYTTVFLTGMSYVGAAMLVLLKIYGARLRKRAGMELPGEQKE